MLTVGDLKYHCRACLVRLNACPSGQDSSESFVIAEYPQLEALINLCLGCPNAGDNDMLESYMPNLCHSCYDKWLDFAKHYQVLRENHEELRKILEKGVVDADDLIQSECVHGEEVSKYL